MQLDPISFDTHASVPARPYVDPLDDDEAGDATVVTTHRKQSRLALVASETAVRFARTGEPVDPMAWMMAPRRMFDGISAIEACVDRDACLRAIVLHAMDGELDADPSYLDSLLDGENVGSVDFGEGFPRAPDEFRKEARVIGPVQQRLFTAVISHEDGEGFVQAFAAIVAPAAATMRDLLRSRHGDAVAAKAIISEGFPVGTALIDALVSPALANMLEQVAKAPGSPLAAGLDVRIEQRFHL